MTIIQNKDLTKSNTFGIHAKASKYVEINSESELIEFFNTNTTNEPMLVLGGGSNVLFTKDFEGIILAINILGKEVVRQDENHVWLRVGAGEVWHEIVQYCVSNNWAGIENLSLIPGKMGAAPIQNIGAYGVEIKEVIESVTAYSIPENKIEIFDNDSCKFGYRESVFKNALKGKIVITHVVLQLNKKPDLKISYGAIKDELANIPEADRNIKDVSDAVIRIRQSKLPDPAKLGNAGSFFKNPIISAKQFKKLKQTFKSMAGYVLPDGRVKVAAGWLIEYCGWKGHRVGNTGCHVDQALVIVNYGGADGNEIITHANKVIDSVWETFEIRLEPEVNIIK